MNIALLCCNLNDMFFSAESHLKWRLCLPKKFKLQNRVRFVQNRCQLIFYCCSYIYDILGNTHEAHRPDTIWSRNVSESNKKSNYPIRSIRYRKAPFLFAVHDSIPWYLEAIKERDLQIGFKIRNCQRRQRLQEVLRIRCQLFHLHLKTALFVQQKRGGVQSI